MGSKGSWTAEQVAEMIEHHQAAYDEGRTEIADEQFDALVVRLRELDPDHPLLERVGRRTSGATHHHAKPMLSLAKEYDPKALIGWAQSTGADLFAVMPKYDGVALSITYDRPKKVRAATRGDGKVGEVVTDHVARMNGTRLLRALENAGISTPREIRGEAVMRKSTFQARYASSYANPRNLVAGLLGRSVPGEELRDVDFVAYDLVGESMSGGERVLQNFAQLQVVRARDLLETLECMTEKVRSDDFPYETDGLVVRVNDPWAYAKLGSTAHHPRGAIALKFQGESGMTTLRGIEWQTSRTGTITPVALVAPVELSGVTISRVTLHHRGRLRELGLTRIGATVEITRRGGVIPHIERVVQDGLSVMIFQPSQCPACGSWDLSEDATGFLRCFNEACDAKVAGRLEHYAKTVGMLGWGPEMIARAVESEAVLKFDDFYSHTATTLSRMSGIGPGVAANLVAEVQRTTALDPATFLAALGLPGIGKTQAEKLFGHFGTIEALLEWADDVQLADMKPRPNIDGFSYERLGQIAISIRPLEREIRSLLRHVTLMTAQAPTGGAFEGEAVVFTGAMVDMEREEARALVRKHGGTTPGSVTMKTTILVVGGDAKDEQRTKRDKAEKYRQKGASIQIIDELEFMRRIAEAEEQA